MPSPIVQGPRGLVWLPCDHPEDGDFLLAGIGDALERARKPVRWVKVPRDDPATVWAQLLGETSRCGVLGGVPRGTTVLVEAGATLPADGFRHHVATIARVSAGGAISLIWPVHRDVLGRRGGLRSTGVVMRTRSFVRPESRALRTSTEVLALLDPEQRLGPRPDVARSLVLGRPHSRGELRVWIKHCLDSGTCANLPPSIARENGTPSPLINADILQDSIQTGISACERLSQFYQEWYGTRILLMPHLDLPNPDHDMRSFFIACVSWLSALLFDSSAPAFRGTIARLEPGGSCVRFAVGVPVFLRDLRTLRTYFQHGLDWSREHDAKTRDQVSQWFYARCGKSVPESTSWRRLALCLLKDWVAFVLHVEHSSVLAKTAGSEEIRAQLKTAFFDIDPQEWVTLFVKATEEFAPHLKGSELERRRGDHARKELRDSPVVPGQEREQAGIIVRRIVLEIGAECPLTGKELLDAGFRDREISVARKFADQLYRDNPRLSSMELLERCIERWPRTV